MSTCLWDPVVQANAYEEAYEEAEARWDLHPDQRGSMILYAHQRGEPRRDDHTFEEWVIESCTDGLLEGDYE